MINNLPANSLPANICVSSTPHDNEKDCAICLQPLEEENILGHTSATTPYPIHFCHVSCLKKWAQAHNHARDHLICALCKQSIDHSAFFKSDPINTNVKELTYDDFFSDAPEDSNSISCSQIAHFVGNVAATLSFAYNQSSSITPKVFIGSSALLLSTTEIAILRDYFGATQQFATTNTPSSSVELGVECLVGATMGHFNAQILTTLIELGKSYATR